MPCPTALTKATVANLGGTIHDDGHEILVDAPAGHHWVDGTCTQLVASPWQDDNGKWTTRRDLWWDLWERVKCGIAPGEGM